MGRTVWAWWGRRRITWAASVSRGGGGLAVRAVVRHGECRRLHGRQGKQVGGREYRVDGVVVLMFGTTRTVPSWLAVAGAAPASPK